MRLASTLARSNGPAILQDRREIFDRDAAQLQEPIRVTYGCARPPDEWLRLPAQLADERGRPVSLPREDVRSERVSLAAVWALRDGRGDSMR